ncbi:hypothetical protein WMY93_002027 [Mugilogobius chulae]|uniref:Zinc finger BED domain-containing protein 5 n=1 Tax=Mugilogobius chulae TaxID=88201 RepID=A0AAW0PYF6_9GOBI
MGEGHSSVLFHSESRWLSRGKVLSRVFELREQIRIFLEEQHMFELASKFNDEKFVMRLAYLSDLFSKLNELNLHLQGKDKHLPHLVDTINSFIRKLEMWAKRVERGNIDTFENLSEFVQSYQLDATSVIGCIKNHISSLKDVLMKYFPEDSAQYDWVRNPFQAQPPLDLTPADEEQFIDLTSDSNLRLTLASKTLSEFWIGVSKEYPAIGGKALNILLPFATSYLCEAGFSAVTCIRTKASAVNPAAGDLFRG